MIGESLKFSIDYKEKEIERVVREIEAFVEIRPALEAINTADSLIANVVTESEELRKSHNESHGNVRFDPKVIEEVADPAIYLIQLFRRLDSDAYPFIASILLTPEAIPYVRPEDVEAAAQALVISENQLEDAKRVLSSLIFYAISNEINILSAMDDKNIYNNFRFPLPLFIDAARYLQDRKLAKFFEKLLKLKERILYPRLQRHASEAYMNTEDKELSLSQKLLEKLLMLFKAESSEEKKWSLKLQTSIYSMFASGIIFSQSAFRSISFN